MNKTEQKPNTLIKQKALIELMNSLGISRISPKCLLLIEKHVRNTLEQLSTELKDEMLVQGRKTLKKEDILKVLSKNKATPWEV